MKKRHFALATLLGYCAWISFYIPEPTVISVRIGQTFAEVARTSTYPVVASSNIPNNPLGSGATWIKEPAVIIRYNDPQHGFTLPATTFAAISYMDEKVDTIATTPMLTKVTFSQATKELASLQRQFQAAGWRLHNDTDWFDLTPRGLEQLRAELGNKSNGYAKTTLLRIPKKYAMTFRIYCAMRCDSKIGLDRYLIDIGIGEDIVFSIQERERRQQKWNG